MEKVDDVVHSRKLARTKLERALRTSVTKAITPSKISRVSLASSEAENIKVCGGEEG